MRCSTPIGFAAYSMVLGVVISACGGARTSGAPSIPLYAEARPVHFGQGPEAGEPYGIHSRVEIRTPTMRETIRFDARADVVRDGSSLRTVLHVGSMDASRNDAPLVALPENTYIEATPSVATQPTVLSVDGRAPPPELASLLPLVATVRIAPLALEEAFGGETPRHPGEAWGVRTGAGDTLARELGLAPGAHGEARFVGYATVMGTECMEVRIEIEGTPAASSSDPPGRTVGDVVVRQRLHVFVSAYGRGAILRTESVLERVQREDCAASGSSARAEILEVTYRFLDALVVFPP